ncbi:MAG: DUF1320 domain-containing protein [Rhodocyclaceae bacterium]|nr:DUF1320 domain-containing protein [Rhodocyclaceae bacterium]
MTYATPTDLLSRFGAEEIAQRADRSIPRLVTAGLLTAAAAGGDLSGYTAGERAAVAAVLALVNGALTDADSDIDGYVATRYAVPLAPVPPVIKRLACDLARYYLYDDQATETIQTRRDAAVSQLRDVAAGKLSLGEPVNNSPVQGGAVEMTSAPSVWRRDASKGFV